MPFDGSGNFNRVMNWVSDAAAAIKIVATRHDAEDDNFAAGLSNTLTKDGQSQPTANIPMNGKKLVNLAAPTTGTDAATKSYVDAIRTFSTAIILSGSNPQARIQFTVADIGFGAREAGTPVAGALNRFVWNDKPDFSGTDVAMMDDSGQLSLLGPNCIMNNVAQVSGLTFVAMSTGYAGWLQYNKTVGTWSLLGTTASVTGGAAAAASFLMSIDGGGHMTLGGSSLGTNTRSSLTHPGDITFAGSGFVGFNTYWDSTAAGYKAATTGWSSNMLQNQATGDIIIARSAGSVAANAAQTLATVAQFSPTLGTLFLDPAFQYGTGSGAVYHQNRGVSVGQYRISGVGNFSWNKSANGLQTGSGLTQQMSLDDSGDLVVSVGSIFATTTGSFVGTATVAVLASSSAGTVFLRPNGRVSSTGQATIASNGDLTISSAVATKTTGTTWANPSDERIKENIVDYPKGLAELLQVQPRTYNLKAYPQIGTIVGVIAQEIETAFPETVSLTNGEIDGEPVTDLRQFDASALTFALINAVKTLSAQLDAATARIAALEAA